MTLAYTPSPLSTAAARLPSNFPFPFSFREPDSRRLVKSSKPLTGPLPWNALTETRIRTRLPIDDLAHLTLSFVPASGAFPPRLPHLVPADYGPPHASSVSWPALKARVAIALKEEWETITLPPYYPFTPSLIPHHFMGLPKFLAGRIHQMRSGKSYLAAHCPDWCKDPVLPTCPRYSSADETFTHAVLECPPREWAKYRFLRAVHSLDLASPVWSSPPVVVALAKFIKATATGFPDGMPPLGADSRYTSPPPSPQRTHPSRQQPPQQSHAMVAALAAAWGASV